MTMRSTGITRSLLSALLVLATPVSLSAQGSRHFTRAVEDLPGARTVPILPASAGKVTGNAVLGASLGLVIGVAGGAILGAALEGGNCSDQCGFAGAIAGAAIGPTLAVPVGLHLAGANRHVLQSLGISAVVGIVGLAIAEEDEQTAAILIVPSARLLVALLAKR